MAGGFDEPPPPDEPYQGPDDDMRRFDEEEAERYRSEEAVALGDVPIQLPANVEAEASLLGALMIDNRLVEDVTFLTAEDFFEPLHGKLFEKIRELVYRGEVANPVSLRPYFMADEDMKQLGGPGYMAQLTGSCAALIGARDFARQIRDLTYLRQLHTICDGFAARALDTSEDVDPATLLAQMDAELATIGVQADRMRSATIAEAWDEVEAEMDEVDDGAEPAGFVIKGFGDWNAVVGRMEEADLIYLGARPSMGKTAVGLAVAAGAAAAGHPTELILLEGDRRKATRRIMANMIYRPGVTSTYEQLVAGKRTMHDRAAMREAREVLNSWPLFVDDPDQMNVEEIVPAIRRRQRKLARKGQTLKLVVIDYLGRLGTAKKFSSERDQVSYISRKLKEAAKVCKVVLVVLVQLSRALESRDNKRPMLADLRDSGSLEQDGDTVVFLYRDEYYLERTEPPKDKVEKWNKWADEIAAVRDQLEIYSSKRREGPLLKKLAKFFTAHQAVRDHNFFGWQSNASPFGMLGDDEPVPGFEDLPEAR